VAAVCGLGLGHLQMVTQPPATLFAGSDVAVRGWLGLGPRFGHTGTGPTDAPGIVLRTRELREDRSEGRARKNILGRTREGIVPTARAMAIYGMVGARTRVTVRVA
jgi:hypothetical protein